MESWKTRLNRLLSRLPPEERYLCAAGIPGPTLELRSGALPGEVAAGVGWTDFVPWIAEATGLDAAILRRRGREIAMQYRPSEMLRRLSAIAYDFRSAATLLRDGAAGVVHRYRGLGNGSNPWATTRRVRLRVRDRVLDVEYPANLVSVGLLWEIFAEEVYRIEGGVERIYDFGANTGLATLYFHLLHPSAELICVEPHPPNLDVLRRNIDRNGVNARVIGAAAGHVTGSAMLSYSDQSHALPSIHTHQRYRRSVPVVAFDEIVDGGSYGLKIDIEGAEGELSAFPRLVENAAWVVGELHYSGDMSHDADVDRFFEIVEKSFGVTTSRPVAYFVGDDVMMCRSFKASRRPVPSAASPTCVDQTPADMRTQGHGTR